VRSPSAGRRPVEISYRMSGWEWEVRYQVTVRGELAEEAEAVSVDLSADVGIGNPTGRAYAGAVVHLVGGPTADAGPPPPEPGILDFEGLGPMEVLTRPAAGGAEGPSFAYALTRPFTVPAGARAEAVLAGARRMAADRVYVLSADEFPLGVGEAKPLRKQIVFRHREGWGLSPALPPGPVSVFLGGQRGVLAQVGRLPRTAVGEDIRIDLGPSGDVQGVRRSLGRTEPADGAYEEVYEFLIENRRGGDVLVEIRDRPPVQLDWKVIAANAKHELLDGWIRFSLRVAERKQERVYYRVRIRQPEL
jgi:hypothetical protein